jgi:hypothetical protein
VAEAVFLRQHILFFQFVAYYWPLTNIQLGPTRHWPEMFGTGQAPETTRKDKTRIHPFLATVSPFPVARPHSLYREQQRIQRSEGFCTENVLMRSRSNQNYLKTSKDKDSILNSRRAAWVKQYQGIRNQAPGAKHRKGIVHWAQPYHTLQLSIANRHSTRNIFLALRITNLSPKISLYRASPIKQNGTAYTNFLILTPSK